VKVMRAPAHREHLPGEDSARFRRLPSTTLHMVGLGLILVAAGIGVCTAVEIGAGDPGGAEMAASAGLVAAVGLVLWRTTRVPERVRASSAFAAVSWTWLAVAVGGAVPFLATGMFDTWDAAFFESVSGFTGTGASILSPIEGNGRGVLLWRQLTQWYGGMGMVVLAVAVLPLLGVGGLELLRAESPGPTSDRLAPRVSETAKRLWLVYLLFSVVAVVALLIAGASLYDAVAHAATAVSTGGFSTYNESILAFESLPVEGVIIVASIVGGVSFALWWQVLRGGFRSLWRSPEVRFFLAVLAGAVTLVTALLVVDDGLPFTDALRGGAFSVVSIGTTAGFGTVDYVQWTAAPQLVLLFLMAIGGMSGSTSGGVKVFRVQVMLAHARRELQRVSRPRAVLPIKLGGHAVPEPIVARIVGFVALFFVLAVGGILALALMGADLPTAAGAIAATMSCVGPGIGDVGPHSNYLGFDRPSRLLLTGYMLLGRLEMFPLLLMFAAPARALRVRRMR
jgi:trk system potassium uptake protein